MVQVSSPLLSFIRNGQQLVPLTAWQGSRGTLHFLMAFMGAAAAAFMARRFMAAFFRMTFMAGAAAAAFMARRFIAAFFLITFMAGAADAAFMARRFIAAFFFMTFMAFIAFMAFAIAGRGKVWGFLRHAGCSWHT